MANSYVQTQTSSRFFVPRTMVSDFDQFLKCDIPGAVEDFVLLPDWYEKQKEGYIPSVIRGEIYPDSTKSRYANTDNNLNFRSSISSGIKKGDIIIDPEGNVYMLDWDVPPQPNNRMSRALRCNALLTFSHYQPEEVDDDGLLVLEEGWIPVADKMPCNVYRHDGRLEFSANSHMPGLIPNSITMISVQYNEKTKDIRVDDIFVWGNETYVIADVNIGGVNIHGTSGVLQMQAKKKAGGSK